MQFTTNSLPSHSPISPKRAFSTLELSSLTAVSPIDGRYAAVTAPLRGIFSEYGLIKNRVAVELKWLVFMSQNPQIPEVPALSAHALQQLDKVVENFNLEDAQRVKTIEGTTRHDVKAVVLMLCSSWTK